MPDESIKPPTTSNNGIVPVLNYINTKIQVKFDGSCLKQKKVIFHHKTVVNIYVVHDINLWRFKESCYFTLENYLFGAVKLTKNSDFDKYKNSVYGIGFDAHESFLLHYGSGFGKNFIIFGADMS